MSIVWINLRVKRSSPNHWQKYQWIIVKNHMQWWSQILEIVVISSSTIKVSFEGYTQLVLIWVVADSKCEMEKVMYVRTMFGNWLHGDCWETSYSLMTSWNSLPWKMVMPHQDGQRIHVKLASPLAHIWGNLHKYIDKDFAWGWNTSVLFMGGAGMVNVGDVEVEYS